MIDEFFLFFFVHEKQINVPPTRQYCLAKSNSFLARYIFHILRDSLIVKYLIIALFV